MKEQWVDTNKIFLNFGVSRYPKVWPFNWELLCSTSLRFDVVLFIMLYKVSIAFSLGLYMKWFVQMKATDDDVMWCDVMSQWRISWR